MYSSVSSIAAWQKHVSALVPSLSTAHAMLLGLISYGVVLFNGCGLTRLSQGLAKIEQVPEARLRQRLREFYYDVDVQACFGNLLRAVAHNWQGSKELALSLDASSLGERFTVLNLSVMYRGCGIPVAWVLLPAHQAGSWRPHWEQLLDWSRWQGRCPLTGR